MTPGLGNAASSIDPTNFRIGTPDRGAAPVRMTWIHDPGEIHDLESTGSVCHRERRTNRRCAMSQLEVAENNVAADTEQVSSAYVPSLQRTEGQPPPIAANGGLSYMSFDRDGDAGTAKALEDALAEIAGGEGQRVIDMIDKAPPGPIKTRWGLAFRDYDECVRYIREFEQPQGPGRRRGAAAGLYRPRAAELFHRSVQRPVAGPGARRGRGDPAQERGGQPAAQSLFPAGAARRAAHRRVLPGPLAQQPRMHGPARRLAGAPRVQVLELLRCGRGGARVLPRDREAPARVLPRRDRCAGLQPRRLRQGLHGRPHGRPGQQESRA